MQCRNRAPALKRRAIVVMSLRDKTLRGATGKFSPRPHFYLVHVVLHAADFDGFHLVLPCYAADNDPTPADKFGRDLRDALPIAEDAMKVSADAGHEAIQPSLRDLCNAEIVPRR